MTSVRSDWAVLASSILELSVIDSEIFTRGSDTFFLERQCTWMCQFQTRENYCERSVSRVQSVQQVIADCGENISGRTHAVLVDTVIVKWSLNTSSNTHVMSREQNHDGSSFRPEKCS